MTSTSSHIHLYKITRATNYIVLPHSTSREERVRASPFLRSISGAVFSAFAKSCCFFHPLVYIAMREDSCEQKKPTSLFFPVVSVSLSSFSTS